MGLGALDPGLIHWLRGRGQLVLRARKGAPIRSQRVPRLHGAGRLPMRKFPLQVVVLAAALLAVSPQPASASSCKPGWSLFETLPRTQLLSVGLVPGTARPGRSEGSSTPTLGDRTLIMRSTVSAGPGFPTRTIPEPER